jgi:hypothetical protein
MPWSELSTGSFFPIDANFAVATFYCFDGKLRLFGPLSSGAAGAGSRGLAFRVIGDAAARLLLGPPRAN